MNIVEKRPEEMSKKTAYMLTAAPDSKSIKDLEDGTVFTVDAYIKYEDVNGRGENVSILALNTEQGVMACQSQTFKEQFDTIVSIFDLPATIKKLSGKTNAGREFITCTYAGE